MWLRQADLKRELVLFLICERETLTDNVSQVVLDKLHGLTEALFNLVLRRPVVVIATIQPQELNLQNSRGIPLHFSANSLVDGDLRGDLRPEPCIFDRCDLFLWVTVHMHVQHHAAE